MATDRSQLWQESSEWQGVAKAAQYKETSKGTPYMEVTFNVDGHNKYVKLWLTEKTEVTTMARLKDLGFNGNFDAPVLARTEPVKLTCKHSEWQGKWYEEWSYWGEKPTVAIPKSRQAALSAAYKQVAGATPTPTRPPDIMCVRPRAPSSSSPPPPRPDATPMVATDENSAWEYWCKKTTDEKLRNEGWLSTVEDIKPKTAADWNRVALAVDIPF